MKKGIFVRRFAVLRFSLCSGYGNRTMKLVVKLDGIWFRMLIL